MSKGGPVNNKYGWKKGETKCNGYVYIYSPNHPHRNKMGKGYVKRSRLTIEKGLGRFLTKEEFVHHKNGIRDDDRKENLSVLHRGLHQSFHQKVTVRSMIRKPNGRFLAKGKI